MAAHKKGSPFGGMLIIAGSCIGAGMLGMPMVTGLAGFYPSIGILALVALFMTATALLYVEIGAHFSGRVNVISMSERTLGPRGKALSWMLYLFLFYALLVAYIAQCGNMISLFSNAALPPYVGSLLFSLIFGCLVFFGTRLVDMWNRVLMTVKIGAFLGLVLMGIGAVKIENLGHFNPTFIVTMIPLLVVSFGFQNMIPALMEYMEGNVKKVRKSILLGSSFVFIVYVIWDLIVLGILSVDGPNGILATLKGGKEASQALAGVLGTSKVSQFAAVLGFFALLTSFLAQSLGMVHFLADGLKLKKEKGENGWVCLLALVPPTGLAILYPKLFYQCLDFAGGICAVILFGILPVLMAWVFRYKKKEKGTYQLMGGKAVLIALMFFALFVLGYEVAKTLGASFIPRP